MSQHAIASPSSAAMWMACPASITLAGGRTRPSSKYAKEGTAAHRIAEMIIRGELFPPERIEVEGEEFLVGREMLMHLNPYISNVQHLYKQGYDIAIEHRVHLIKGLVWGTADCIAHGDDGLVILDLKYGRGVPVAPDSAQLKIYALAAIDTFAIDPRDVALVVHQPRLNHVPGYFPMPVEELYAWRGEQLDPAIKAIMMGDTTEKVGPHCRWCVRRDECYAFSHRRSGMAADAFDDGPLDSVE